MKFKYVTFKILCSLTDDAVNNFVLLDGIFRITAVMKTKGDIIAGITVSFR